MYPGSVRGGGAQTRRVAALPCPGVVAGPGCRVGGNLPALSSSSSVDVTLTPDTSAEKFESFKRINSIRETNKNFDSCNSCKRLVPSRSHELHESKFPFVSRIEFIRSKLSNFSAHVSGVTLSLSLSLMTGAWPRLLPSLRPPLPAPVVYLSSQCLLA